MNKEKINSLIKQLDWDLPVETQWNGIEKLKNLNDIDIIMDAKKNKKYKENCALILANYSIDKLLPYSKELLEWLQDENTPGFFIIHEKLQEFPKEKIEDIYYDVINRAKNEKNDTWLENLETLHW